MCIIFTCSFAGAFAGTTEIDWTAKASEDAKAAYDLKDYMNDPIYINALNDAKQHFTTTIGSDITGNNMNADRYRELYSEFLDKVKEVKTFKQLEEDFATFKKEKIDYINLNKVSAKNALKKLFTENEINTYFDKYIKFHIDEINEVTLDKGWDTSTPKTYENYKTLVNQHAECVDITTVDSHGTSFRAFIVNEGKVDYLTKYAESKAAQTKLEITIEGKLKYNAATIDKALNEVIIGIQKHSILDESDIDEVFKSCLTAEEEAVKRLSKAQNDAILSITTGDYALNKWANATKVKSIQDKYIAKINTATTIEEINLYVDAAKKEIQATVPVDKDKIIADLEKKLAEAEATIKDYQTKIDADAVAKTAVGATTLTVKTTKVKSGIKVMVSGMPDLGDGYTVNYKFYRATSKNGNYTQKITKDTNTYINTSVKKGTKYYYKAIIVVYDSNGIEVARTNLADCKYGTRRG